MPIALTSTFDGAFWFADTALNHNEYLQPQKLQRLLFVAQAYYAVLHSGQKLMPAVFVADDAGPIEPNIYKGFINGRPDMDAEYFLDRDVEDFLETIWRRFGHFSVDYLTKLCKASTCYEQAFKRGKCEEITIEAMRLSFARADNTPSVTQVVRPKVMRTQEGKAVRVKSWVPGTKPPEGKE